MDDLVLGQLGLVIVLVAEVVDHFCRDPLVFDDPDLVGHDGGISSGDFAQSLNFVDILTGWDESCACINKAQVHIFEAIGTLSNRFPFKITGIDL